MTRRALLYLAFMSGVLAFAAAGSLWGYGLPQAEKDGISIREGSAAPASQARRGRFFGFRSGK